MNAALRSLLDRPIAYHRCFVAIAGSVSGAVFLSQVCYWSKRTSRRDGFFYKTDAEWCEETGIPPRTQDRIRAILKEKGILLEKLEGIPATVHYKMDDDALLSALGCMPSGMASTCQVAELAVPSGTTISEITRDYKDRETDAPQNGAHDGPLAHEVRTNLPKPERRTKASRRIATSGTLSRPPGFVDYGALRRQSEEQAEKEQNDLIARVAARYAPKVGGTVRPQGNGKGH